MKPAQNFVLNLAARALVYLGGLLVLLNLIQWAPGAVGALGFLMLIVGIGVGTVSRFVLMPAHRIDNQQRRDRIIRTIDSSLEREENRVPCPYCAELILPAARSCKHCGRELTHNPM